MKRLVLALALTSLVAGCGVAPMATGVRPVAGATASKAANPWLGLKDVTVRAGGPSDWYTKTRRHLAAKTAKNGVLWVMDDPDGVRVAHNTQQMANAKKLAQIVEGLEEAARAKEAAEPEAAAQIREFVGLVRATLK